MLECVLLLEPVRLRTNRVFRIGCPKPGPGIDWNVLANYMITALVVHGDRRAREREESALKLARRSAIDRSC